jgi:tRNA uridine 5-carbamoylmethylation protein Kti12
MKMMDKEGITYAESFNAHILQAEFELVENLKAAVRSESNIILDQLNLTAAVRRKKLLRVPPEIYNRVVVPFPVDESILIERNNERSKKDMGINENILKMYIERFTPPLIKEGFDEIWGKDEIRF